MKLSQKRSCEGCRALGHKAECSLGFRNQIFTIGLGERGVTKIKPQQPCYKPLTIRQLIDAENMPKHHPMNRRTAG